MGRGGKRGRNRKNATAFSPGTSASPQGENGAPHRVQRPSFYPPGILPAWWDKSVPDPREEHLAGPGWILVVCREERARARAQGHEAFTLDAKKKARGLVVFKGERDSRGHPYVPLGWEYGDCVKNIDLVHNAIVLGRHVRYSQKRECVLSGYNISYGKRLPIGNGGVGYNGYSVKPGGRGEGDGMVDHTELMQAAGVQIAGAMNVFPKVKKCYLIRAGSCVAFNPEGEPSASRTGVEDDALRGTPLHHLNTTVRSKGGMTFSCKPHSDNDAQAHQSLPNDECTGNGQLAFFLWVPKGVFEKPSFFVLDAAHVSLVVAGEGASDMCSAFVCTVEEHHTSAGFVGCLSDLHNDVAALSVEVGKNVQSHLLRRLHNKVEKARKKIRGE